jgi:uncharacterized lipoprotein
MCKVKPLFLSLFLLLLAGCTHFADGNRVSAPTSDNKSIPPLQVPPGLSMSFDTLYPIPQRNYPKNVKQVDISPPSLYTSKNAGSGWFSWY